MAPRKRWALVFALVVGALYYPLTRTVEPAVRAMWFRTVTPLFVTDARALRPPPGKLWLGASRPELPESTYGLHDLEALLGKRLAIASFYQAWGEGPTHAFPRSVVESLHEGHYLPMITWEPWLTEFSWVDEETPRGALARIASGEFDAYITGWAQAAVRFGHPLMLRIGHEVSNPWYGWAPRYGNSAADYVAFFRHVHRIFVREGAKNVLFVWTPFTAQDRDFFPGREVVDWIGLDVFNYGAQVPPGLWRDFPSVLNPLYNAYADLQLPFMLAEVGTTSMGGEKAAWVLDMFNRLADGQYPQVRAVVLFDHPRGENGGALGVDWTIGGEAEAFEARRAQTDFLSVVTREGASP